MKFGALAPLALLSALLLTSACGDDSTPADSGSGDSGSGDTGSGDSSTDDSSAADTGPDPASIAARAYCNCMLVECHDAFHEEFGVSDVEALENCQAAGEALPMTGMAGTTSGNSLECRQSFCDGAGSDEAACASALGGAPCE